MNQRPALALTSELVMELMSNYVHTAKDTVAIVEAGKLVSAAGALCELLGQLRAWR
jgi:hypothetical protein